MKFKDNDQNQKPGLQLLLNYRLSQALATYNNKSYGIRSVLALLDNQQNRENDAG
jgi:hypothetical protein